MSPHLGRPGHRLDSGLASHPDVTTRAVATWPNESISFAALANDRGVLPMLTLYFAPGSSSMAPHIALHEIGAPFNAVRLAFSRRENHTPAYLALNPEGKVPTLVIDGRPLTEVAAILFYLAKCFPDAGLW